VNRNDWMGGHFSAVLIGLNRGPRNDTRILAQRVAFQTPLDNHGGVCLCVIFARRLPAARLDCLVRAKMDVLVIGNSKGYGDLETDRAGEVVAIPVWREATAPRLTKAPERSRRSAFWTVHPL
jgi:hypothetical protein